MSTDKCFLNNHRVVYSGYLHLKFSQLLPNSDSCKTYPTSLTVILQVFPIIQSKNGYDSIPERGFGLFLYPPLSFHTNV